MGAGEEGGQPRQVPRPVLSCREALTQILSRTTPLLALSEYWDYSLRIERKPPSTPELSAPASPGTASIRVPPSALLHRNKTISAHSTDARKERRERTPTPSTTSSLATSLAPLGPFAPHSVGPLLAITDLAIEVPLRVVGHLTRLVGEGMGETLELGELGRLEDDDADDLIERGVELLVPDHLGDERGRGREGEGEGRGEVCERDGRVEGGVGEEVRSESLLLDFPAMARARGSADCSKRQWNRKNAPRQHVLDGLLARHQVPHLDAVNELDTLLPVSRLERLGRLHDVIALVLGRSGKDLTVGVVEHAPERARDDLLLHLGVVAGLRHEGNLEEHRRDEVRALEELEVDVHVEGELALALDLVLFGRKGRVPLCLDSLREELLDALGGENLLEGRLGLADEAEAEGAKADLDDGPVVEDLGSDVRAADCVLEMGHEEHVARRVVVVVEGVVVDVGEHRARAEEGVVGLVEVDAERANEGEGGEGGVGGGGGAGLGGPDARRSGELGEGGLEGLDNGVGLCERSVESRSDPERRTHLAVNMLEAAHENSVEVLRELNLLKVDLCLDDGLVDLLLVLEAIDVLAGVRVDVLQALGELVVQSVDQADDAAANDDRRLLGTGSPLVEVVVVARLLADNVGALLGKGVEKKVEVGAGAGPGVDGHVRVDRGVVVEEGGDEGEEDANALVGSDGDGEELFEDLGLLRAVGVLREKIRVISCVVKRGRRSERTLRPRASRTCARALKMPSEEMVIVLPLTPTVWKSSSSASTTRGPFFLPAFAGAGAGVSSTSASRSKASGSCERNAASVVLPLLACKTDAPPCTWRWSPRTRAGSS